MTTVPKDQMGPLLNTGGISKKSAVTGKGQVNTLPPPTMIGREPLPEMTAVQSARSRSSFAAGS